MFNENSHSIQNKLVREISKELNIDSEVVEKVIRSQWELIRATIKEGNFLSIRIKYLGLFGIKNFRCKYEKSMIEYHVPKEEITRHVDPRNRPEAY